MSHFYDSIENQEMVDLLDELSYWSAPFGMSLLDAVNFRGVANVLDIGFGLGFPLLELAMRFGNTSQVFGIDPWQAGTARASQKMMASGISNVSLITAEAEDMPFEDNIFDLIVSNNGINNVRDMEKVLAECNRVSRKSAQLVFTMNTDQTFMDFYRVYRESLHELGLQEYNGAISRHIFEKRIPLLHLQNRLLKAEFRIRSIREDSFTYRFANGTAMLDHSFIKLAFLPSWKEILPEDIREPVFKKIEEKLNEISRLAGQLAMRVPFVTVDCKKD